MSEHAKEPKRSMRPRSQRELLHRASPALPAVDRQPSLTRRSLSPLLRRTPDLRSPLLRRLLRGRQVPRPLGTSFHEFWASLARASGDIGRRFFATFLVVLAAVRMPVDAGARPTARRTSATSTSP